MSKKAELHYDGNVYDLPVLTGIENETALDISKLRDQSGLITLDRGFKNTGSCKSAITFLNGEKGALRYRGYSIEELAEHSTFLEVAFLLIYSELPTQEQLDAFSKEISEHSLVHEDVRSILDGFPSKAHPMGVLSSLVSSLTAFYPKSLDPNRSSEQINGTIIRAIAKLPTLAAWSYKNRVRQPIVYPKNNLSYAANFMQMMFALPTTDYVVSPVITKAIDKLLILHADHEQNASTSTVRLAASSGANPFACIAAGIACLWGPAHGGANEAALKMLKQIGSPDKISEFILKAKDKNDPFRLMGFGHRVYKNFDPRSRVMKQSADEVLELMGIKNNPTLQVAKELEKIALEDEYFIEKKLYPNVDFYSGIILEAMGFSTSMFTPIFALARTVGWLSQWQEMISDPNIKIGRPRQLFTGKAHRDYLPFKER